MSGLVFLIEQVALGLYILFGVAVVLCVRALFKSISAYRSTYFELERDIARYHRANSLTLLILLIEAVLVVVGIQRVVAPTLRETLVQTGITFQSIASDGVFVTPTPFALTGAPIDASGIQLEEQDPAERVLVTPTLTPTPVGTIRPNAPAPVGCDTDNAKMQIPANGMVVFEPINVVGQAFVDNFAFYRFEIKGPSTFGNFAPREDHSIPVQSQAPLGQFVPSFYEPGEYEFRLAVFDLSNALKASCTVTIYITEPIPTATPIGQNLTGVPPTAAPAAPGG